MTHLRIVVIIVVVFAAISTMADPTWEPRGIGGGGALYSITLSPHDPDLMYLATDMGVTFQSNDSGVFWRGLPFTTLMGGLNTEIRFTSSPNVLYTIHIGDWDTPRQPVRSNDGGQTFVPITVDPTEAEAYRLFADPNSITRIMINDWTGVYFLDSFTSNEYTTILEVPVDSAGAHLAGVFWDNNLIVAGTNHGLLVSENGGATFSLETPVGIPDDQAIMMLTGAQVNGVRRLFAVTLNRDDLWGGYTPDDYYENEARLYRFDWGDIAWGLVHDHSGGWDPSHYFVAMALNDINTVYLGGHLNDQPSILKSTDAGITWQPVFHVNNNQNIATGWMGDGGDIDWHWPGAVLGLAVDPNNADRVVMTDLGFVHRTEDGGQTWHQAYVHPDDENPMGAPTPQGQAYRTSGIEQTSSSCLYWLAPEVLFAGFADFTGARSTDGGHSWAAGSSLGLIDNETLRVVKQPDGSLYASTSNIHDMYQSTHLSEEVIDLSPHNGGHIMTSDDNGATWEAVHNFECPVVWLELDPLDPETLYASVVNFTTGGIYVTHNLSTGTDFTLLPAHPRTEGHPFNIRILNDCTLVTSWSGRTDPDGHFTESSGVYTSVDGGQTWLDRSHPNMSRWTKDVVIDPNDPTQNTWFACVFSHWGHWPNELGGIYRTTDRGQNWDWISDLYRVESITFDPLSPGRAFITSETLGLWVSEDLNASDPVVIRDDNYPIHHPYRVFFNPYDPYEMWCTSFGSGLSVSRRGVTSIEDRPPASTLTLEPNRPNPFNPRTTVAFSVAAEQMVDLGVFDAAGRRINTLLSGLVEEGRHEITWNGCDSRGLPVPSGIYFARITGVTGKQTRKMMLVR